MFSKISKIKIENSDSWAKSIFLTFDIDWASDEVLSYCIDLVETMDVEATWFVTHQTDLLSRLRKNPKFELGIHPNFNFLLAGDFRNGSSAEEVVDRMLTIVPEAVSVRSHSMTQSSGLLKVFKDKGLQYDCNHFIPEQTNMIMRPWAWCNGLIKVPYFWEDDVACLYEENSSIAELKKREGLRVFDFHPIHVFLNTENLNRYQNSREFHFNFEKLKTYQNLNVGAQTYLQQLLEVSQ